MIKRYLTSLARPDSLRQAVVNCSILYAAASLLGHLLFDIVRQIPVDWDRIVGSGIGWACLGALMGYITWQKNAANDRNCDKK